MNSFEPPCILTLTQLYIGEACWAFLFGVVIGEGISPLVTSNQLIFVGPYGANIFDPRSWGNGDEATVNTITLEFTRIVLAISPIGAYAIGSCTILGTDDLLAAFAAGTPSSVGLRHGTTLLTSYAPLPLYRFSN